MAYPIFNDEQRWGDITQTPSWQTPSPDKMAKDRSYLAARARMAAVQEFLPNEKNTQNLNVQRTKALPSSYPQPFRTGTMPMTGPDQSSQFGSLVSSNAGNTRMFPSTPNTRADLPTATGSTGMPVANSSRLNLRSMGSYPSDTGSTEIPRVSDTSYGGQSYRPSNRRAQSPSRTRPTRPDAVGGSGVVHSLSRSLEFYHALTRHSEGGNAEILRAYQGNNE